MYICQIRSCLGVKHSQARQISSGPLNLTFLLSPDILISNTQHFVRGQLLAEKQRKMGGGGVHWTPSFPYAAPLPTWRGQRGAKRDLEQGEGSPQKEAEPNVCVHKCVRILLLSKANSKAYNPVRGKEGVVSRVDVQPPAQQQAGLQVIEAPHPPTPKSPHHSHLLSLPLMGAWG